MHRGLSSTFYRNFCTVFLPYIMKRSLILEIVYTEFSYSVFAVFKENKSILSFRDHYFTNFLVLKHLKSPESLETYEPCHISLNSTKLNKYYGTILESIKFNLYCYIYYLNENIILKIKF